MRSTLRTTSTRNTSTPKAKGARKEVVLENWRALAEDANPLAVMEVIPYKAKGSTYGACGIRIDGTPEFVDAILGKLKSLLDGENTATRLNCSRRPVETALEIGGERKHFGNTADRAEVCYVRLCERGPQSQAYGGFTREEEEATIRFADARKAQRDDATEVARIQAEAYAERNHRESMEAPRTARRMRTEQQELCEA